MACTLFSRASGAATPSTSSASTAGPLGGGRSQRPLEVSGERSRMGCDGSGVDEAKTSFRCPLSTFSLSAIRHSLSPVERGPQSPPPEESDPLRFERMPPGCLACPVCRTNPCCDAPVVCRGGSLAGWELKCRALRSRGRASRSRRVLTSGVMDTSEDPELRRWAKSSGSIRQRSGQLTEKLLSTLLHRIVFVMGRRSRC